MTTINRSLSLTMFTFSGLMILAYSLKQFGGVFSLLAPLNIVAHGALVFWFLGLALILI